MNYSITPVLHNHNGKNDLHKINIVVIYQRKKAYSPTPFRVKETQFFEGKVVDHPNHKDYNSKISDLKNKIERRLIDALRVSENISKEELELIAKNKKPTGGKLLVDFIYELADNLKGKFSVGRLSHYKTMAEKVASFSPNTYLHTVSIEWLQQFEAWLRKQPGREGATIDGNSIQSNMSLLKSVMVKAKDVKLMNDDQYKGYKVPLYKQKIPEYLTEDEMQKFYNFIQLVEKPPSKLAGYYFLLGCYAGYRISDMKKFNYEEAVRGNRIRIRTKKNKEIVTMLIHTRLQQVIDFLKDKTFNLTEKDMRLHVKELASFIGISRKIKVHTSRTSFGMMLAESGFSLEEAAELLGDTIDVARIYFRMTNKRLDEQVKTRLG